MPELRIDPITGRRVYVAEDRAGRPTDFAARESEREPPATSSAGAYEPGCPFCFGNEAATPIESCAMRDDSGRWQIRVVPNKYPAVALDSESAVGAHEVIVESPDHLVDVTQMSAERLVQVFGVYRQRLQHWAADARLRHGLIFKNSGFAAGASLLHVHSQLVALPYVPEAVQAELSAASEFHRSQAGCIFCDLLAREAASGERIILRRAGMTAVAAIAGRQPYETWILPDRHEARFDLAADGELEALASVVHELLERLAGVEPGAGYNLLLHSGPFDLSAAATFHWHWELIPRLTQQAGFEWGAGVFINPLAPERAAARLRERGA